ncbi:MAG: response regulator [Gemmatimonadaceae bacterium]|nr:response regulator [Gemmatimonadaceae bacterium]
MTRALDLPAAPVSSARILCVDDDAFMRRAFGTALRNRGFTPRLAESAGAAMEILRTEPVDIVLTDQQMPGMSGLDLMQKMREEGFNTPVILCTGFGSVDLAVTAVRAGAVHFLTKPVDPIELDQLITDILETPLAPRGATTQHVTPHVSVPPQAASATAAPPPAWLATLPPDTEVLVLPSLDVAEAERLLIVRALERTANNRSAAAALLGMHPRTLRRKMRAMHMAPNEAENPGD